MKNILLIITLLISWNAIAEEKTWFCATEKSGGLIYKDNAWKSVSFKAERMTVKQQDDTLSFVKPQYNDLSCNTLYSITRPGIITCKDGTKMFTLNTNTGLGTSSESFGWIGGKIGDNYYDTLDVSVWKCESF